MNINLDKLLLMLDESKAEKLKKNPNIDINELMPIHIINENILREAFHEVYLFRNSDYLARVEQKISDIEKYAEDNKEMYAEKCYYIDYIKKYKIISPIK